MMRYRLVDEQWAPVGSYDSDVSEWAVGQEFFLDDGRGFAIVAIVPSLDPDDEHAATWTVEPT